MYGFDLQGSGLLQLCFAGFAWALVCKARSGDIYIYGWVGTSVGMQVDRHTCKKIQKGDGQPQGERESERQMDGWLGGWAGGGGCGGSMDWWTARWMGDR